MAEGTVDSLSIQLSADAGQAVKSLNNLSSTLKLIGSAFSKDISGMRKFSKEIGRITVSLKSLNGLKVSAPNISEITKMMKTLESIDSGKAKNASDGIEKIVKSFNSLSQAKFSDTGINKTVNALNRLFKADFSKFRPNDFRKIANSISTLGNMPDVSSNINRFVSSLFRLANAGDKTSQAAAGVKALGEETRQAAIKLQSVGAINEDVNLFVQSIARLASAGERTGQTASGLNSLADETLKFFQAMQNAPKISQNTIAMTQALAQLASAGGRVGTATNTVTNAFKRLSKIGTSTMNALRKASSGIVSSIQKIANSGKGLNSVTLSLGNILRTAAGFSIGYGLLNFGKQAIQLGSNITEVENVVDVAFGSMSNKAYEFASTATEQYGLSELAAKQYAGTMMAMLNSTGVAQDAAAEMSTTLAGLAGDLASFYNIETDDAFRKLRSAIAGEIEPMRELGVNMSVASLQSYALSQGITESWQSMTQAEQALLRYNYIMTATGQAQGDYQRTIGSFANQWRLLTLNVQHFSATIGQGLIAAVLPAIQAINALFSVLQKAATAFRNFMYVLTGYDGGGSGGAIIDSASSMGDIASASDAAADGIGDAADNADDLKKKLSVLPFDQLNQLADTSADTGKDSGGSDSSGIGDAGLGSVDDVLSDLGNSKGETYVNKWAERIREAFLAEDWEGLGEEIAKGLNRGLQKVYDVLNWKKVGPKITAFTTAFTKSFNSLVDNFDWDLLGRTIGTGINTIVNTLNQLIDGVDWVNLGTKFTTGFNGLVDEVNWNELGRLIGNKFMIAWDTFYGFVTTLDWAKVGKSLADGLNGIFSEIDFGTIGTTLGTLVSGILTSLNQLFVNANWASIGVSIGQGINNLFASFSFADLFTAISNFCIGILTLISNTLKTIEWGEIALNIVEGISALDWGGIASGLFDVGYQLISGLLEAFSELPAPVQLAAAAVLGFMTAFKTVSTVQSVVTTIGNFAGILGGKGGLLALLGKLATSLGGPVTIAIAAVVAAGALIIANWDEVKALAKKLGDWIGDKFDAAADAVKKAWKGIGDWFGDRWDDIKEFFKNAPKAFKDWFDDAYKNVQNIWKNVKTWFGDRWTDIKNVFSKVAETFKNWFSNAYTNVKNAFVNIGTWFSNRWEDIKDVFSSVAETFKTWFGDAWENVKEAFKNIGSWFSEKWEAVKNVFGKIGDSKVVEFFSRSFSSAYEKVKSAFSNIKDWFSSKWEAVKGVFGAIGDSKVVDFFNRSFSSAYEKVKSAFTNIGTWFSGKWTSVKNVFGAIGDSKVVSFFERSFDSAYGKVKGAFGGIGKWFSGRWNDIKDVFGEDGGNVITNFFSTAFQNAYDAITGIWDSIKTYFVGIANQIISPINGLIGGIVDGINWIGKSVGVGDIITGWSPITFARGSDGVPRDTIGVVNDQKGSTYKELIVPPSGKPFIPKGRNVMLPLQKGTKIMPADQTKEFMKSLKIPKFAGGIGEFFGNAWNAVKEFTGNVFDYLSNPGDIVKVAIDKFASFSNIFEPWLSIAGGMVSTIADKVVGFITGVFDDVVPQVNYNPSAGVEQWRDLAKYALNLEGQYTAANLDRMLMQMQTESSGNPNAINDWDINAQNGVPSMGLMQVIEPTFRAYARPGYNKNIWDPLSNMLASIRYTVARYGSLARGWQGHGYAQGIGTIAWSDLFGAIPKLATGGLITAPTLAFTGERYRKEAILPLENRRTMRMIAGSIMDNSDGAFGLSQEELQNAVAQGVAMAMMNNRNNQPITVYAELKTENDEVLARAVTRGQQKIDYRTNPTAGFAY